MSNTSTANRLSYNFVSAMGVRESFIKRGTDPELHNPFGNDNVAGLMMSIGRDKPVHTLFGVSKERTRSNIPITATSAGAGADGAAVTLTATAASTYTFGSQFPYEGSNDQDVILPQNKDILMFDNGVQGIVSNVNLSNQTFDVTPLKTGAANVIPAVTGKEIINLGQRTEEGSGNPEPTAFRPTEHEWRIFMKKHYMESTDVNELASIDIPMPDGSFKWTYENWQQLLEAHMQTVGVELLVGQTIDNPNAQAIVLEAPSGNGYIPYSRSEGRGLTYDPVAGPTESEYEQLNIGADSIKAPKEYCVWGGTKYIQNSQKLYRDLSGYASFATFGTDENGKNIAVNLNHKSICLSDRTYHLKSLDEFNHPGLLGAANFNYQDVALVIPMLARGAKNDLINVLSFEAEKGDYKGGYEERFMSGINGNSQIRESREEYTLTTRKGVQPKGQKKHALIEPQ